MAANDLQKWITSDLDFYEILGIKFEACSEGELRRAYRKTALKYHPDKVGANFDAGKYEIFQAAYQILSDSSSKAQYDQYRHAKIQRQRANALFEGKRKQMKEDLEAREKSGISDSSQISKDDKKRQAELQPELQRFAEEGRKRRAARASMMAANTASFVSPTHAKGDNAFTKAPAEPAKSTVEDEKIEQLERRIKEAGEAKAKRKAEKKARKSGLQKSSHSFPVHSGPTSNRNETGSTSISSTPAPKLSFSPPKKTSMKNDFAVTMARLRAAEKARLESESKVPQSEVV